MENTIFSFRQTGQIFRMINDDTVVTLVSHTHPDGDAIGSTTAFAEWLSYTCHDAAVVLPDAVPQSLSFLDTGFTDLLTYDRDRSAVERRLARTDLLICMDFNAFSRTGDLCGILCGMTCPKILIDHHLNPDRDSFDVVISKTDISSTSELTFWILANAPGMLPDLGNMPHGVCEALLAGMTTDTNNFANSVYPSTFAMASKLLALGVDRDGVLSRIYNMYRENRLRLMGEMLTGMKILPHGVACMILDTDTMEKYDFRDGESEGFVNMPLAIADVRMSIFLKADSDYWRVSVRSKAGTSANLCAKTYFNGGGHEQAAGGKIFYSEAGDGTVQSALRFIEKATDEFFSRL